MNSYDHQHIRAHIEDNPDFFQEYHQDYREGLRSRYTSIEFWIVLVFFGLPIIYHILSILQYDLPPLPELFWNILVYFTPSRLIDAAENYLNPLRIIDPSLRGIPRTHAAKSEAMRRILGLDKPGGIMGSVAQAGRRRLSTLPGINITSQGANNDKPAGLGNWDNSCYQNSVLQGLASLDTLPRYLTNPTLEADDIEGARRPEMKMAEALRGLIEHLNDPMNNGKRIWTPATLKNMNSWTQQDAQEYFSKILDEIDKEVGTVASALRSSQGFESDDRDSESLQMASFRNPLEGLTAQRVGCTKCGYAQGLTMTPFNCLTLPLGRAWEHSISDCLDEYTKLEQIEGVECGRCTLLKYERLFSTLAERTKGDPSNKTHKDAKQRLTAITEALEDDDYEDKTLVQKCQIPAKNRVSSTKTKQVVIARPPKSLVLHFNRSIFDEHTGELRKNSSDVRFPKFLDLGPWCLGSSETDDNGPEEWRLSPDTPMIASTRRPSSQNGPIYEVRAVVTHQGRHENGHYVCYRKHALREAEGEPERKQWWRLSDDDVIKVSEDIVLNQGGVFMLFYDLVERASPASQRREPAISIDVVSDSKPSPLLSTHAAQEAVEMSYVTNLSVAASIPLPFMSDDDLSEDEDQSQYQHSLLTTDEPSIATSVSELDDEDANEAENFQDHRGYKPVKPIIVQPYLPQTGVNSSDGEGTEQQKVLSSGSLLMV